MNSARVESLRQKLDEVQASFQIDLEIVNDPVHLVLEATASEDREVLALLAAVFAYGNVKQIQKTLRWVFEIVGPEPSERLKNNTGQDWRSLIPPSFKHRFNTAEDLGVLLTWMGEALRRSGSLENFFNEGRNPEDTLEVALESFVVRLTSLPCAPYRRPKSKGALFFLPRPSGKSACKRLLLFMRWVAGHGPMDLNLWKTFPRSRLLIPVDTHVLRISRHLGLTKRKDNTWKTAVEITESLKLLDPEDPTRFDFALCHLGISRECPSRFEIKICGQCRMNNLCLTYRARRP